MILLRQLTVVTTYWYYYAGRWWAAGSDKLWVPGRVQMVGVSVIHSPNFPEDATVDARCDDPPLDPNGGKTLFHIWHDHVDLPLVPFTLDQLGNGEPPWFPYPGATCFPIICRDITLKLSVMAYDDPPPLGDSVTVTFALEPI